MLVLWRSGASAGGPLRVSPAGGHESPITRLGFDADGFGPFNLGLRIIKDKFLFCLFTMFEITS